LRGEYIEQLNTIRNLLKGANFQVPISDITRSRLEQRTLDVIEPDKTQDQLKEGIDNKHTKLDTKELPNISATSSFDLLKSSRQKKTTKGDDDISESQIYRERMILMNRIDIYRLFITVIIISAEIKYPRKLTSVEERELKIFIEQLNEFENMVLNLNINEHNIWEKGKTCEKQILQLFTNFFKV
jgi:hypothetical protein